MTVPMRMQTAPAGEIMEAVLLKGDIAKLTPAERVSYYNEVCRSLGMNPLTKPFEFIVLNGKMQLYALRTCTDQLRKINGVSLAIVSREIADGILTIHVKATLPDGRADEDLGVVAFPDTLKGEARANAELKAVTKAKRRATLSICGLGWLDETEVADIPASAKKPAPPAANIMLPAHDATTGEVIDNDFGLPATEMSPATPAPGNVPQPPPGAGEQFGRSTLLITVLDGNLAEAAEKGTAALKAAWKMIAPTDQKMLEASLNRRHKPRAAEVDAAVQ